jgi:hypothetical protein
MWSDFQFCGQLQERGICKSGSKTKKNPFDGKMKKTKLYKIIKLKKPEPFHKTKTHCPLQQDI